MDGFRGLRVVVVGARSGDLETGGRRVDGKA